ncbi:hypothetical protein IEQ34_017322 [Dendrobium chrysotoxum]|uniref:Uncharacterized protein n=1 Tax=Dendrobium chrysotoxum TaxID=161865 RepID=A0AAV7GBC9_DENCH|nr:hypothetical protein IEQ34_017322 [Dendrobium chrysotoxum]
MVYCCNRPGLAPESLISPTNLENSVIIRASCGSSVETTFLLGNDFHPVTSSLKPESETTVNGAEFSSKGITKSLRDTIPLDPTTTSSNVRWARKEQ